MKNTAKKTLAMLLALVMVIGLMPGMSLTAYATPAETLLTTITATGKEQANYSTANVATVSFSYTAGGSSAYLANWGWWGYGWTATVNAAEGYTITRCVFYDDANRKATDSEAPFVVETTEEDKTPRINGTPIDGGTSQSKGLKKIEVYGYATPAATHSVTVTPGSNMTKTAGSGDAEQTGLTGAMTDVVYTANDGYYFPEDYAVTAVNGISVTRDSYTQITVSGTPTANAEITLAAPTAKTTPDAPTAAAVDCTTADNNDGTLTGVTTAMEYKKADAADWTAGTGSDITGLVPGTYYVRVKATDTTNASANQELTIKGFISYTVTFKVVNGKWNEGEDDAATADKTATLTGHDGDTLKLTADQIPAVGSKPNDTYKAGSWDTTPSADTAITAATTYTYTYAEKEASDSAPTGSEEGDALAAKQVTFNGKPWYVIKDESETAGTLTLLYAGSLGNVKFDDSTNVYADSSIKEKLDGLTAESGYYYPVAEAIKDTENGKLYLLSVEEANDVPLNVRKDFPEQAWWLRTARDGGKVAYVYVTAPDTPGRIPNSGAAPTEGFGVRPALQLDLSKVVYVEAEKAYYIPATAPTNVTVTGATLAAGYGAGSVSVTATAAAGHTLSYQWYQSATNSNEGGTLIEGATSATYNIPTGNAAGVYYYYCVVTATRTDNSQTANATSGVAIVTVAADTDALVAKLAEENNIDLSQYYRIPAEDMYFTANEYWNINSSWEKLPDEAGKKHVATKQFTMQGLPENALIFCKAYNAFEAVAWGSTGKSETIGKRYSLLTKISDQFNWWGEYSLFGFNLTKYAEGDFNTIEEANLSSISDAFRIYVPKPADAAELNGTRYPTVAAAIRAAGAGDTVKLLRNVTENVVLTSGKNITLDLNGYTLTNDGRHCTIVAQNGSTLVVTGNGTVDNTTHGCAPLYNNGGTVTLNGGNFIRSQESGIDGGNTYYTVVNRGTMTINEGVTVTNDAYHYSSLIINGYNGLNQTGYREIDPKVSNGYVAGESAANPRLTINGGTFTGGNQALKNDVNGIATISGGSFSSTAGNAIKNLNDLTISGGTFTAEADGKFALYSATESGTATVTGGTFNGKLQKDEGASIAISGGEFSEIVPEDCCAEGYQPATTKNSNGKYIVTLPDSVVEKAPTPKTLTYNGSAQELVTAGEATGGTMRYALGQSDNETIPATAYLAEIPARTEAGTYYVWYKVVGDANHNDTAPACVTVTIANPVYGLVSTNGVANDSDHSWYKGSGKDVVLTVKLSGDNDVSFEHFTGVSIDGAALSASDYSAAKGSTVVTLKAAALEKLKTGPHGVRILFDNGKVDYTVTVKPAQSADGVFAPKTGDESNAALWLLVLAISGAGLAAVIVIKKRRA